MRHKEAANGRSEKGFLVLESEIKREGKREHGGRGMGNILIFIYDW